MFSESKDEDLYAFVESSQLTVIALKKCLQLVNVLVHYVFEVDHFTNKCLKFMYKMEVMIASCMAVCEDMHKPAKKSKVTSFSLLSLPSPCTLSFSPSDNFQSETHASFQETPTHICASWSFIYILSGFVFCGTCNPISFHKVFTSCIAVHTICRIYKVCNPTNREGLLYLQIPDINCYENYCGKIFVLWGNDRSFFWRKTWCHICVQSSDLFLGHL